MEWQLANSSKLKVTAVVFVTDCQQRQTVEYFYKPCCGEILRICGGSVAGSKTVFILTQFIAIAMFWSIFVLLLAAKRK